MRGGCGRRRGVNLRLGSGRGREGGKGGGGMEEVGFTTGKRDVREESRLTDFRVSE